jgi:hypothetical protein
MRRRRDLILVNLIVLLMLLAVLLIGWWEAAAFGLGVLVVLNLLVVLRERQARSDHDLDTDGGEAT